MTLSKKQIRRFFIENTGPSEASCNDEFTFKISRAWAKARPIPDALYKGVHTCDCGKKSSNSDYRLPTGEITNSLCVHYVQWHRSKLSKEDLDYLKNLP